jgi:hypothetical protein
MKNLKITLMTLPVLFLVSCNSDDDTPQDTALFAVPKIESLQTLRTSISVEAPQDTDSEGKIYVATGKLFYIAQEEGVHIFNNQNPASPQNIAFINIPGVHDIAVKENFLYADNFVDLLVFDISNINNITLVKTVENVIQFYPQYPIEAEFYDWETYPAEGEIITGYETERRARPEGDLLLMAEDALANFESTPGGSIGVGGSYAKFQINENALYTTDTYQLNVFNITEPDETFYDKSVAMYFWLGGGQFETLFKQKDFLFVGATNGMYVVDATDEFNPFFVSGFSHATACDPVVVSGNTAYITVRGGNSCGAIQDQVNVIDITDVSNPTLVSTTLLGQPYGLGFRNDVLYVCCGNNGLKVFDATNPAVLDLENTYDVNVKDVIPLSTHLIAVGNNTITQYSYGPNHTLTPLSVVNF